MILLNKSTKTLYDAITKLKEDKKDDQKSREEKKEEKKKNEERKKNREQANNANIIKKFNPSKELDFNLIFAAPVVMGSMKYTSENSDVSSRLFGQPMSGDDQFVPRDDQLNSDIERSFNPLDAHHSENLMQDQISGSDHPMDLDMGNMSSPPQPGSIAGHLLTDGPSEPVFSNLPEIPVGTDLNLEEKGRKMVKEEVKVDYISEVMSIGEESEFIKGAREALRTDEEANFSSNFCESFIKSRSTTVEWNQKLDFDSKKYFENRIRKNQKLDESIMNELNIENGNKMNEILNKCKHTEFSAHAGFETYHHEESMDQDGQIMEQYPDFQDQQDFDIL